MTPRKKRKPPAARYVLRLGHTQYICRDGGRLWFSPDAADAMTFDTQGRAHQFLQANRQQLPALGRIDVVSLGAGTSLPGPSEYKGA